MIKPPRRENNYEKVPVNQLIDAVISDIEFEEVHVFKYGDKATGKTEESEFPGVRFVFEIKGCKFPHKSRWMKLSYSKKSNIYTKYLATLVPGARPDMDFDLETLKGTKIRMLWTNNPENPDYQNIQTIIPVSVIPESPVVSSPSQEESGDEPPLPDEIPF